MYLKKLELQGFKSFADKTTLEFKPGITAVIGPNGSGKSNISDAIRWVLGEQSIKNLRGSKLEDVIFAGTQARKSVSYAEVSITMDNSDGKLPVDYSEVTITRRVYRSGESEFFINKNQCRLKDIVELFMDTGIGRDGYSIIGQGRIDEVLSTKSEERRRIFEDAAGIVKYRTRKEEAEKKLENTRQNLLRIQDIVTELENQLEPLREQSEKAKKFLEIRDQLKYLEVGLFIHNINKNKSKLEEIKKQVEEVLNQTEYEDNKLSDLQKLKEEVRTIIESITKDIEELQTSIFEMQNKIEKHRAEIAVHETKVEHNLANIETFKNEIITYQEKEKELDEELEERKKKKARLFDDKKKFEDELKEKEEELKKLSEGLTNEQKKVEELKAKIMKNIDIKFEKMEILKDLTANSETVLSRAKQIDDEVKENIYQLDKEKMKKEDEKILLNKISKEKNELKEKLDGFLKIKEEYSAKILEFEELIRKNLDETNNKESRYKFLVETENEFEGYNRAVKEVMLKAQKDKAFGKNICGTIANLMKVPSSYELAIEMALGGMIQNIVTETEEDAKQAIEYLKKNNFGRASFLPLTAVKGEKIKNKLGEDSGMVGIAADLIEYEEKYQSIFYNLLGKTVVVDTMDNAIALAKKQKYSFRIVTLEGDILNVSGQMTGGSTYKKTTSLLSRSREIEELKKVVEELKNQNEQIMKDRAEYEASANTALSELNDVEKMYHEAEITYATENEKMISIESNIDRIVKKNQMLNAEKTTILEQSTQVKNDIDNIRQIITNCEEKNAEMQQIVDEFASKNSEQQKIMDDLNSDIMDLKISVSSFDESSNSMEEMLARIENDKQQCVSNVEKRSQDIANMLKENDELEKQNENTKIEIDNITEKISELEGKLSTQKEDRSNKNAKIVEVEKEIENQFKTLDILHDQATKLEVKQSKVETDIEEMKNKMWEDYETTLNTAQNYAEVTPNTAKEVDKYKTEIKSLGNININAIEEYKAVGERYEFLRNQKIDLEESAVALEKIIHDMIELMKIQFAQNFEKINKNFGEVFVELFGGGHAELTLVDAEHILESGIEITVQPPGKKLQNMMLLSGGERALTAIALLFAILRLSPSPFCILDEIEAALDDVNVYRYADYLKKFSKDTQFLVITHRKGSMEAANTVYGATMQEHGITKLVSMKLDEV